MNAEKTPCPTCGRAMKPRHTKGTDFMPRHYTPNGGWCEGAGAVVNAKPRCEDCGTDFCHKLSDPAPTVEAPDAEESSMSKMGPWFEAKYEGPCGDCGTLIEYGDMIRASGEGDYLCTDCGDENDPVNDDAGPGFVAGPPAPAEVSHWQQQAREAAQRHVGMMDAAGATVIGPVPRPGRGPRADLIIVDEIQQFPTPESFMDPATPEETPAVNVSGQPDPRYEWWGEQNRGYLVKLPETGDFRRYKNGRPKGITRATTFNKAASDTTSLTDWKLRNVIIGASKRPDLLLQAHDLTHKDSARLNKLAAELEAVAGAKVGADIGTFLHEFCEHIDAGLKTWKDAPQQYQAQLKLYSETLAEAGFEPVPGMIERTTYIAEFGGVVGRFDRILFHRPSGTYLIADLKTGRTMDYARLENECQEWIYARGVNQHGVYDWNTDTWAPMLFDSANIRPFKVSETVGLIIHMPVQGDDAGQVILERTDLQRGKRYAATCAENRGWAKPKRALWTGWPETAAEGPWHDAGGGLEVRHTVVMPSEEAPVDWRTRFRRVTSREEANTLYREAKGAGVPVSMLGDLVVIGKDALARLATQGDAR